MNDQRPAEEPRTCPHCGREVDSAANLCPHCAHWLNNVAEQLQQQSADRDSANTAEADTAVDAGPETEAPTNRKYEASAPPYHIHEEPQEALEEHSEAPGIPISPAAYSVSTPPSPPIIPADIPPDKVPAAPSPAYQYPTQQIPTFQNVPFWPRVAAMFIDGLIISVPIGIIMSFAFATTELSMDVDSPEWQLVVNVVGLFATIFRITYFTLMEGTWGATVGKMLLGMRVVRADGSPITYGIALGRIAVKELIANCTCMLGYLSVAFNPEYRGWHDQLLRTRVVYPQR